jgi:hypothetical protein
MREALAVEVQDALRHHREEVLDVGHIGWRVGVLQEGGWYCGNENAGRRDGKSNTACKRAGLPYRLHVAEHISFCAVLQYRPGELAVVMW